MKYADMCEHLERMARRDRDGATQAISRLAKRLHEANAERLEQAAAAIRELEAERDKYEALALLNLQENATNILRAEAAEAKALKDAKAHEKEIAVWSENYAALERKVARLEEALADMPKAVLRTTVCQGPQWPDDRPGVWLAALEACAKSVQTAVNAAISEGGKDG